MNDAVLVFASIIMGVAVADQLTSLQRLLRRRKEVRWDWLLLWVAAAVLLTQIQLWWTIAGQRETAITIGAFLPLIIELILLFLLAAASLPDGTAADRPDLRQYYDDQSRYIWSLYALALGWLVVVQMVTDWMQKGSYSLAGNLDEFGVLALMASMAIVKRRAWHVASLVVLTYTGPIGWLWRSLG